jgi:hypothetical protein
MKILVVLIILMSFSVSGSDVYSCLITETEDKIEISIIDINTIKINKIFLDRVSNKSNPNDEYFAELRHNSGVRQSQTFTILEGINTESQFLEFDFQYKIETLYPILGVPTVSDYTGNCTLIN